MFGTLGMLGKLLPVALFAVFNKLATPDVVIGRPTPVEIGSVLKPPTIFPVTVAGYPGLIGIYCETALTPGIDDVKFYAVLVKLLILLPTVPNALVGFYTILTGSEIISVVVPNRFDRKLMLII